MEEINLQEIKRVKRGGCLAVLCLDLDQFKSVKVEVKNGVARLSGSVPNYSDRLEAAMIARATSGVRSVHEELTVTD